MITGAVGIHASPGARRGCWRIRALRESAPVCSVKLVLGRCVFPIRPRCGTSEVVVCQIVVILRTRGQPRVRARRFRIRKIRSRWGGGVSRSRGVGSDESAVPAVAGEQLPRLSGPFWFGVCAVEYLLGRSAKVAVARRSAGTLRCICVGVTMSGRVHVVIDARREVVRARRYAASYRTEQDQGEAMAAAGVGSRRWRPPEGESIGVGDLPARATVRITAP